MPLGSPLEEDLLNFWFRGDAYVRPGAAYLAFWTVAPTVDGTGGTEVSASGYSRTVIPMDSATWAAWASGVTVNLVTITGPTFLASSGSIVLATLMSALTGGEIWWLTPTLSPALTYTTNQYSVFGPGALTMKLRA